MEKVIPKNTAHIRDVATGFEPDRNLVFTGSGTQYSYDYLIVAPGIQIDWDAIPGLAEGLGKNGICSIYSYRNLNYVEESIKKMTGGTVLFTQPATKFKCGGASQKIVYLASDTWRKKEMRENIDVRSTTAGTVIFSLGDAGSTPNAKTGAAVRKQSKVVTGNLISLIKNGEIDKSIKYNGYGSCPLITGFGKLILAEFDYDNNMTPSFPINQAKERSSMDHMKKDLLPIMYGYGMLKGRA